ncbi:unnamed protein product [Adineta ricciae]|uniref:CWH43-like N-terminal domain-containing protein n=1 Tax=Adineta ricciae TaxID=249248 RepID=A0A814PMQ4_ADIRI|nr:unnamed protein product [Adineta ricciae]CAF1158607.1 unnamed protein product [Adineta ricciae]
MSRLSALVWYWSLVILPFSTVITFIITLIVCGQVLKNSGSEFVLPYISQLGIGPAYPYFVAGFVLLCLQMLFIIFGRLQYLFQSQSVVSYVSLCFIHAVAVISGILLLIMSVISLEHNAYLHIIAAFGMFICISLYCLLNSILSFYLYSRRSVAPLHASILWPLWYLLCGVLLSIFAAMWMSGGGVVPQYIAAGMPFLYNLGFVPQFLTQARSKQQNTLSFTPVHRTNDMDL